MDLGALLTPFVDPASRTWWGALLVAAVIGAVVQRWRGEPLLAGAWARWTSPSSRLDVQLLVGRQLLRALGAWPALVGSWYLATHLVRRLDALVGRPEVVLPEAVVPGLYALTLFVAWDASRYVLHRLMHAVPALWAFHQVHHSAEVLTPLTFHRVHPVESLLYELRGVAVTALVAGGFYWLLRGGELGWTVLGVHALGWGFNVVSGNLRHSHVWWSFGRLERWLLSPAQHQLHHSPAHERSNFGTWLAVWDRALGTLTLADRPPERFGVDQRNHGDDLFTAWGGPFVDAGKSVVRWGPTAALLLPFIAQAQDDDPAYEILVVGDEGLPEVAGSAHEVTEEQLERFEHDDIHKVLAVVPGVTVREEDGFGLRPNIGIRGANSNRSSKITLLEDGVLLAPAPYASPAAYYFPLTTRMVGVEVFKGASAVQYGPHTVGGTINLVTRPVPLEPDGAVDVAAGWYPSGKVHAWGGTGDGRSGVLLEAVEIGSSGFKELDGGGPTGFDRTELMFKARLGGDADGETSHALELKLGWSRERSHETYAGLSRDDFEVDPDRRYAATALGLMEWSRTQAEASWPVRIGERFDAHTVAYHHYMVRTWRKLNRFADPAVNLHDLLQSDGEGAGGVYLAILRGDEDSATPDQNLMIGTNDRQFHAYGVQSRARWTVPGDTVSSRLELGLRVHGDDVVRVHSEVPYAMRGGRLRRDGDRTVDLDALTQARALAAHVHETFDVGPVSLQGGARVEHVRTRYDGADERAEDPVSTTALLPGVGTLVQLARWLDALAGVHRGFSPIAPGSDPGQRPEQSWNTEAGLRLGTVDTRAELIGFYNDYGNLTSACTFASGCLGDRVDRQVDGGEVTMLGTEALLGRTWALPGKVALDTSATHTWTVSSFDTAFASDFDQFGDVEVGDWLPYVPVHQG
ncbi:MAG: Fe(3+) dicitrate transport protein, partial [Myxococcota bacterium]